MYVEGEVAGFARGREERNCARRLYALAVWRCPCGLRTDEHWQIPQNRSQCIRLRPTMGTQCKEWGVMNSAQRSKRTCNTHTHAQVAVVDGMGHDWRDVVDCGPGRNLFGRGQIIAKAGRVLCAGSDPRADGMAVGWS